MKRAVFAYCATAAVFATAVSAQERTTDPGDSTTRVAPVEYRSAFEGYRPFTDQEAVNWRRANEEVGTVGGHKGHLPGQGTGANAPVRPPLAPAKPATPAPQGHGGHK